MDNSFYLKNGSVLWNGAFTPLDMAVEDGHITALSRGHHNEKGLPRFPSAVFRQTRQSAAGKKEVHARLCGQKRNKSSCAFPPRMLNCVQAGKKSGKLDWKIRAFQYTMKREQKSIVLSVESGEIQIFFIFS